MSAETNLCMMAISEMDRCMAKAACDSTTIPLSDRTRDSGKKDLFTAGASLSSLPVSCIEAIGIKVKEVELATINMVATEYCLHTRGSGRTMNLMESVSLLSKLNPYFSNNGNSLFAFFQRGEAHGLGIMKDSSHNIIQKGIWKRGEFDQTENSIDEIELKKIETKSVTYSKMKFESGNEPQVVPAETGTSNRDKFDGETMQTSDVKKEKPKLQDKTNKEKVTEKPAKSDEPKKKIKKVIPGENK